MKMQSLSVSRTNLLTNYHDRLGETIDHYVIERMLGEGAFSVVYEANDVAGGGKRALKLAKEMDSISECATEANSTQAMCMITGGAMRVTPDTYELLDLQARKIASVREEGFATIANIHRDEESCYYLMELIEGGTLRESQQSNSVWYEQLVAVARCLARLEGDPAFDFHGDLKPENIMIAGEEVRLIDPGYFGRLANKQGVRDRLSITTPAYYPYLLPDDLFAFGLILWEMTIGWHPLIHSPSSGSPDQIEPEQSLLDLVRSQEAAGNYRLSPLARLNRPSDVRDVSPRLEALLLKAIRLRLTSRRTLETEAGYKSFLELAEALENV